MPEKKNEIAADVQTLRNLGVSHAPGSTVELDGENFTLTGIVSEMPENLGDLMGDHMQGLCKSGPGLRDERKFPVSEI